MAAVGQPGMIATTWIGTGVRENQIEIAETHSEEGRDIHEVLIRNILLDIVDAISLLFKLVVRGSPYA